MAHHGEGVVFLVEFFSFDLVEHFDKSFEFVAVFDEWFFDHEGEELDEHNIFGFDLADGCVEVFDLLLVEGSFLLEFLLLLEL